MAEIKIGIFQQENILVFKLVWLPGVIRIEEGNPFALCLFDSLVSGMTDSMIGLANPLDSGELGGK
jgi:hypothetical protein